MKMKLIFPPTWEITSPYPSIPCLAAYLSAQGEDVEQVDMNLLVFDHILSKDYITGLIEETESSDTDSTYRDILSYCGENIDACKDTIRSQKALDPLVYRSCRSLITTTVSIINKCWQSENISFGTYQIGKYNKHSSESLFDTVDDIISGKYRCRLAEIMELYIKDIVQDTDVVGLSVTSSNQILPAFLIATLCKKYNPNIKIVAGGSLVTRWSLTLQKIRGYFRFIDYFSFYEGEKSLAALMKHLKGELALDEVPSLCYLVGEQVVMNPAAESIAMDELPTPLYDKNTLHKYLSPKPVVTLFTCRGCYWNKCAFCDHAAVYQDCFRTRSIDKIIDDIERCIKEYDTKYFAFNDEAITAPMLKKLSQAIVEKNIDIRWRNDSRFDKALNGEILELAYKAGLRILFFGLESYNERVLSIMNKGIKREWVEPIIKATHDAGIWSHVYVISGFPTETMAEFQDTVDFAHRNKNYIDSICFTPFMCSSFSDVAKNPEKYGMEVVSSEDSDFMPYIKISQKAPNDNLTFNKRFELSSQVPAAGNQYLDVFSNTISVIFSDYIIECSKKVKNEEESTLSFGTPLFSADGKIHLVEYTTKSGALKHIKVSGTTASLLHIIYKNDVISEAKTAIAKTFGYPEEIAEFMMMQAKSVLEK